MNLRYILMNQFKVPHSATGSFFLCLNIYDFKCDSFVEEAHEVLQFLNLVELKGVAKKTWCFKFCNFDFHFLKENYRYIFEC